MSPQAALSRQGLTGHSERRLHSRHAIERDVFLMWQDRYGDHQVRARALDVSKYGMLVETESKIPLGVVVFIGTGAVLYGRGCVRHCTQSGEKCLIGLNTPDHITALMVSVDSPLMGASR
jgi:hypothetical protein